MESEPILRKDANHILGRYMWILRGLCFCLFLQPSSIQPLPHPVPSYSLGDWVVAYVRRAYFNRRDSHGVLPRSSAPPISSTDLS